MVCPMGIYLMGKALVNHGTPRKRMKGNRMGYPLEHMRCTRRYAMGVSTYCNGVSKRHVIVYPIGKLM